MTRSWYDHYAPGVPQSLDYESLTLPQMLNRSAQDFASKEALIFHDRPLSFHTLDEAVNRLARALLSLGVKGGDRVALLLPNMPQIVIAAYAAWRIGAVVVMHNPLYSDRELEYQLNDCGASVLVALDLLCPRILALRERTALKTLIVAHLGDHVSDPAEPLLHQEIEPAAGVYEWQALLEASDATDPGCDVHLDDLACLQYSGGTTGVSKGAMLTHANLSCNVQQTQAWFQRIERGRGSVLAVLPYFHSMGLLAGMNIGILHAQTQVLVPRPEVKTILELIQKYRITLFPAVPTLFTAILAHPDFERYDLSSLEVCVSGGAPIPVELIRRFEAVTKAQICEAYGLTEASPLVTVNPFGGRTKVGSVGLPLPDTEVKIVDLADGHEALPPGEEGEIVVKGVQIMKGYYHKPEENRRSLQDGWLHTGDIGRMDEEGYLYIVDRKKDLIIASGYNIYPTEIDQVLYGHPKVLEACTVGVPDDYRGETVKAFVVCKPGETVTAEEIIAFCRESLARYKVPRSVEFLTELPKSGVGKILRKELRQRELERQRS